tara:strand:- start:2819 stop:3334 length:516 start_codon:yes stop_codon:yes gene_type:complete
MHIAVSINNYNIKNVILQEPVKNILRSGCEFIKILYSDINMILNGIYLKINLKDIEILKRKNDMLKMLIDKEKNKDVIELIINIEMELLNMFSLSKMKQQSLYAEFGKLKYLKLYANNKIDEGEYSDMHCILRIFGIWYDDIKCGLNYQLIPIVNKHNSNDPYTNIKNVLK